MNEIKNIYELEPTLQDELINIDEKRLPQVLTEGFDLLSRANQEYKDAQEKEKNARNKVANALERADKLVETAGKVGGNTAKEKKFLWVEWTSKADEIDALKKNLGEIIKHGENSALAQKELVEVQSALTESQTALLKVQETQMAYQKQIAEVTKFLYGLSAINMASTSFGLTNLKNLLSGASKEKIGEMAHQQLLFIMDQIKNQESIVLQIRKGKELIRELNLELEEQDGVIKDLQKQDEEQDALIEDLQKQDEKQDVLIEVLQKQDEEQDALIENLQKQDEEHDVLIEVLQKQDEEQDTLIENLQKQDEEQDSLIEKLQKQDEEQDILIGDLQNQDEELRKIIVSFKKEIEANKEASDVNIDELNKRVRELEHATSKWGWKIGVSIIAGISFVLSMLQLLGIV